MRSEWHYCPHCGTPYLYNPMYDIIIRKRCGNCKRKLPSHPDVEDIIGTVKHIKRVIDVLTQK